MTGSTRGGRGRRGGSRLLLAASLLLGAAISLYAASRLSDALADLTGIDSLHLRLGLKVLCIAVALPAGFYLVERLFLDRSRNRS